MRAFAFLFVPVAVLASFAPRSARAEAGVPIPTDIQACTEAAYGMPCNDGDGNACGGVCQPDFSSASAPMKCLAVDAATLARLKLPSLDGLGCSPAGAPGTDCAHVCSAGSCVATNAPQGAACMPSSSAVDAGFPTPLTVCSGACDGNGACGVAAPGCPKYGRGELSVCLYTACNLAANTAGCAQFVSPTGTTCSSGDVCLTGETCGAQATCTGGTRIANCTEPPDGDASLSTHGEGGTRGTSGDDGGAESTGEPGDAAVADATTTETGTSPSSSSSGCSMTGGPSGDAGSAGAIALGLAVAASLSRRRSCRGGNQSSRTDR
jgi:hypothetical protein